MRDPRRVVEQATGLVRASRAAGRAYGSHPLRAAMTARRLRRRQGYEYAEALRVGLLDPSIPDAERALYVSRHANLEAAAPLNHGNEVPMLSADKSVFYRYCRACGIPIPELYGVLDRRGSSWSTSGRIFRDRRGFEEFLARDVPGEVIVKPSLGYMGRGVWSLVKNGDGLVDITGVHTTAGALWDELMADPEFDEWIVQERMHNHADLVSLAGDASLHSARITTIVDRRGRADLLFAFVKLSIAGTASDNFLGGTTGNGVAEISVNDGRIGPLLVPHADRPGIGFQRLTHSPVTGAPIEGTLVPHWEEACRLVLDAAPRFLPTRALGWDVALAPAGPVTLETNTRWVLLPLPTMRRVYERVVAEGAVR